MAQPRRKKTQCDNEEYNIFNIFAEDNEQVNSLKYWTEELSNEKGNALAALRIKFCNAAVDGHAFSFKNAICLTDIQTETLFSFTSIFTEGLTTLQDYIRNKTVPSENHMKITLSKLLHFMSEDSEKHLVKILLEENLSKTDLAVILSQHFFSKLAASPTCVLDKSCPNKRNVDRCCCGCEETFHGELGDTSIGNPKCWHGNLDILLCNSELFVKIGTEVDVKERRSDDEVKVHKDIQKTEVINQILAQTIVFSYLQKKRHPEYDKFLIPSIGVSNRQIIFHFYDSENDILMKSPAFPLFTNGKLNMRTVLSTWFVLNYKYLSSGLTSRIEMVPKAEFETHLFGHADWYENGVTSGNVTGQPSVQCYEPLNYQSKFVLPEFLIENI